MPLPLAHTSVGVASFILAIRGNKYHLSRRKILAGIITFAACANIPDLDFIPGILVGKANKYHHGISHSLIFSFIAGLVLVSVVHRYFREIPAKRFYIFFLVTVVSHPLLDLLSLDTSIPYGVPLLWPAQDEYIISSLSFFRDVTRSDHSNLLFFTSLLNSNNLFELYIEFIISISMLGLSLALSKLVTNKIYYISITISALSFIYYYYLQIHPQLN